MASVKRYDVCTPRPKHREDGVWWHRIGNGSMNEKGQVTVWLESLPIPDDDGKVVVMLFEKREEQDDWRAKPAPPIDDEVPY